MKKGFKRQASMDMFIVRSPKKSPAPSPTKDRAGMRQATLESLKGVVVVEDMERAVVVLERLDVSPDLKMDTLQHLLNKNPAKEVLIRTGLGKTVHKLCHDKNSEVAAAAQKVYRAWKKHILSKVNRPCIEVKTDLRTQRLRNSARQMLSDALQREDGGGGEDRGSDDKRRRDSSDGLQRDNELDNNNKGRISSDAIQRVDRKEENNDRGRRGSSEEEDRIRDRIVYEVFKRDRNRDRHKEDNEGRSEGIKAHKRTEDEVSERRSEKRKQREEEGRIGTTQKRQRQDEEEEKDRKEKHRHKKDEKRKDEKEKESKEGRERTHKSKKPEKEEKRRDTEKHKERNPVQTSSKEEKGVERGVEGGRTKTNQSSSEKKGGERGEERKTKDVEKHKEKNPVINDSEEDTSARHDPVEVIAEHIEREVYHGSQRLVDNAYRRTVRALVFTLRHQAEVRRTVSSATLSVPEFVKQYRKS